MEGNEVRHLLTGIRLYKQKRITIAQLIDSIDTAINMNIGQEVADLNKKLNLVKSMYQ